ncbi:hypothetical protein EVAR_74463_1 [Eumeta japonica]|uniref:Uncharacterized protein n=1 Tax=Eumeta variegata TaxID=151549 RepID=A0A4C1TED6_EUMVA|nr:hypothetical protein EVAR_74463_1 [Eumeta japonica]
MKVDVGETKLMVFERGESTSECDILIDGETDEQAKGYIYLDSLFTNDGKHDRDIERKKKNESRINVVEMRLLCSMCGVSRKDTCRYSDVRERSGLKKDVMTREKEVCFGGLAIWKDE